MDDQQSQIVVQDARQMLAVVLKRRGLVMTCLAVSIIVATVYNYSTRPLYQATVQIVIDRGTPRVLPSRDLVSDTPQSQDYLNTQYHLLRGSGLAERVIQKLNLQRSAEFQAGPLISPWERIQRRFFGAPPVSTDTSAVSDQTLRPIIESFRSRVSVEPVPSSNLVNVRFTGYDPVLSAHAVNTLAQIYIEQSMENRFNNASDATGWLGDRMKDQKAKVDEAEKALQAYREREGFDLKEGQGTIDQKLGTVGGAALAARSERLAKEAMLRQMRSMPASQLASLPMATTNPAVQQMRSRLGELQREQARMAESLGERHPDMVRTKAEIRGLEEKMTAELQSVVRAYESDYQLAAQQEASLLAQLEQIKLEALEVNRKAIEYGTLKREVDSNQQLYQTLMTRTKETGLETELKSTNVRIIEKAQIPRGPVSPRRAYNYQIAVLVGLALGLGLVLAAEQLDNTLKTPEDVKKFEGLPYLGMVADVGARKAKSTNTASVAPSPLILKNPRSALADAYRVVRTNLIFSLPAQNGHVIAISSVNPAEGKSTTVVNVAASLAQNGARVLVVDADLRRPTIHQHFGLPNAPGLSDLIVGKCDPSQAIRGTSFKGLDVLPCGYIPPNPAELLGSGAMRELIAALRERYEWVLIDTPPVLAMADTPVVSRAVDGIVLVVAAERTGRPALQRTIDQIRSVGGRILGAVLNRVDLERNSYYFAQYYGEYYRSYYAEGVGRGRDAVAPGRPKDGPTARQA